MAHPVCGSCVPYWGHPYYPMYHQIVTMEPSPSFQWAPRRTRINWSLVEDMDVDGMATAMDVGGIEWMVQHVAFAELQSEDLTRFHERAAVKAFRLLQLGVEYLTHLKRPLPTQPDSADIKRAVEKGRLREEELEQELRDLEAEIEREEIDAKNLAREWDRIQLEAGAVEPGEVDAHEHHSAFDRVERELVGLREEAQRRRRGLQERVQRAGLTAAPAPPQRSFEEECEEMFRPSMRFKRPSAPAPRRGIGPQQGSLPT